MRTSPLPPRFAYRSTFSRTHRASSTWHSVSTLNPSRSAIGLTVSYGLLRLCVLRSNSSARIKPTLNLRVAKSYRGGMKPNPPASLQSGDRCRKMRKKDARCGDTLLASCPSSSNPSHPSDLSRRAGSSRPCSGTGTRLVRSQSPPTKLTTLLTTMTMTTRREVREIRRRSKSTTTRGVRQPPPRGTGRRVTQRPQYRGTTAFKSDKAK